MSLMNEKALHECRQPSSFLSSAVLSFSSLTLSLKAELKPQLNHYFPEFLSETTKIKLFLFIILCPHSSAASSQAWKDQDE